MSDLRELYQETIIDHGRKPRNFGKLSNPTYTKQGYNPLCGDIITVYISEKKGVIDNVYFEGSGCAISLASASLMTESLKGKTMDEFKKLFKSFHHLMTTGKQDNVSLGKLAVLSGVCEFPSRVKCATLSWHTMKAALQQSNETVSTE